MGVDALEHIWDNGLFKIFITLACLNPQNMAMEKRGKQLIHVLVARFEQSRPLLLRMRGEKVLTTPQLENSSMYQEIKGISGLCHSFFPIIPFWT